MRKLLFLLLSCTALTACSKSESEPGSGATTLAVKKGPTGTLRPADKLFLARCSPCHGVDGKGDGPAAMALKPAPRDFGDPTWQAGVTDAELAKVIVEGGAAVGKSAGMPPAPDLGAKQELLKEMISKIRAFKR